jgi:DNA-binding NtrC family response regulator
MERLCAQYRCAPRRFDDEFLAWLAARPWPGNVRELENFVHREFLRSDAELLRLCARATPSNEDSPAGFNLARARALTAFETTYLRTLLAATHGNVSEAARRAGKERRVFGRMLKRNGIERSEFA